MIIIASQLKSLLGIKYSTKGFIPLIWNTLIRIKETRVGDTVLGLACIVFLIALRVSDLH
jgi:sodium-independent sulfate anion transporter 11